MFSQIIIRTRFEAHIECHAVPFATEEVVLAHSNTLETIMNTYYHHPEELSPWAGCSCYWAASFGGTFLKCGVEIVTYYPLITELIIVIMATNDPSWLICICVKSRLKTEVSPGLITLSSHLTWTSLHCCIIYVIYSLSIRSIIWRLFCFASLCLNISHNQSKVQIKWRKTKSSCRSAAIEITVKDDRLSERHSTVLLPCCGNR